MPAYRLYDRDIGKDFQPQSSGTLQVQVNQGTTITAVERLIIPDGHNLSGMELGVHYSSNGSSWVQASSFTASTGDINTTFTSQSKQYWRFTITTASTVPSFAELFLTNDYTFESEPLMLSGPHDDVFNVENLQSVAGHDRFITHGDPKVRRGYAILTNNTTQRDNLLALSTNWAGAKPFWVLDHTSNWYYMKLNSPIDYTIDEEGIYSFTLDLQQVLS
ncbi:MAG: hypothetical protein GY782_08560 [Gammaproteobacteria bacterium]|nr:hypothetical protein [Gammaproteobacteria bacterium]